MYIKIKNNKVMKAKNYIPQISVYYSEKNYNDYNNAIQQAIKRFIVLINGKLNIITDKIILC